KVTVVWPKAKLASVAETVVEPAQPLSVRASQVKSVTWPLVPAMVAVCPPPRKVPLWVVTLIGPCVEPLTLMVTVLLPSALTPFETPGTSPESTLRLIVSPGGGGGLLLDLQADTRRAATISCRFRVSI